VPSCSLCCADVDQEVCAICSDPRRDQALLCVVAGTRDLIAIERTHEYRGLYHVLGGVISPMDGVYADQLRVKELLQRLERNEVNEVILAMRPQVEGEATALYLHRSLQPRHVRVTRMAHGRAIGRDED
jgi:recombination protein RecR